MATSFNSSYGEGSSFAALFLGCVLAALRSELLVANRAHTRRQSVESDEAGSIALLIDVVLAERDEALIIQRVLALTADHACRALEQLESDVAGHAFLGDVDECVVGLTLGGPPAALIDQVGITGSDEILGR